MSRTRSRALAALSALATATGCALESPEPVPLPVGDLAVFAATTQPVLDRDCASSACHGRAERPFALYSPGQRRLDPGRTFLIEPLAPEELAANARAVAAFALDPIRDGDPIDACLVLRKPLARAAGGAPHAGGELYAGTDDRG